MSSLPSSTTKTESSEKDTSLDKTTTEHQDEKVDVQAASTTARTSKKRTAEEAGLSHDLDVDEEDEGYDADSDNDMSDYGLDDEDAKWDTAALAAAARALTISAGKDADTEVTEAGEAISGFNKKEDDGKSS